MYPEDKLADVIGLTREQVAKYRQPDRITTKGHGGSILWTHDGVKALLADVGIPADKTPPALLMDVLSAAEEERIRSGELRVHRVPGNPETTPVILALDGEVVVRVLIRRGDGGLFRRGMKIQAVEKTIGFWKLDLKNTRLSHHRRLV